MAPFFGSLSLLSAFLLLVKNRPICYNIIKVKKHDPEFDHQKGSLIMLDFLQSADICQYIWEDAERLKESRGNLGEDMPVSVYRLFQYTMKNVLIKEFGKEKTTDLFRQCGKAAGQQFAQHMLDLTLPFNQFISQLQETLRSMKIGVLRFEKFDEETGHAVITVSEDLDCSGLPVIGETVCDYDEGFIAGILQEYTHKEYVVVEVDCWATGARVCRFDAKVQA